MIIAWNKRTTVIIAYQKNDEFIFQCLRNYRYLRLTKHVIILEQAESLFSIMYICIPRKQSSPELSINVKNWIWSSLE